MKLENFTKNKTLFFILLLIIVSLFSFFLNFSVYTKKVSYTFRYETNTYEENVTTSGFSSILEYLKSIYKIRDLFDKDGIPFLLFILILLSLYIVINKNSLKDKFIFYKLLTLSIITSLLTIYLITYLKNSFIVTENEYSFHVGLGPYLLLSCYLAMTIFLSYKIYMVENIKTEKGLKMETKKEKEEPESNKIEIINLIKNLEELKNSGILTEEEFEEKKKKLLEKI